MRQLNLSWMPFWPVPPFSEGRLGFFVGSKEPLRTSSENLPYPLFFKEGNSASKAKKTS